MTEPIIINLISSDEEISSTRRAPSLVRAGRDNVAFTHIGSALPRKQARKQDAAMPATKTKKWKSNPIFGENDDASSDSSSPSTRLVTTSTLRGRRSNLDKQPLPGSSPTAATPLTQRLSTRPARVLDALDHIESPPPLSRASIDSGQASRASVSDSVGVFVTACRSHTKD